MLSLPPEIMQVLRPFAQAFSERIWDWVQVLIVGAILAPGKRTVTAALRVMGLSDEQQFQNYHRVLNRAKWSGLRVSQILLGLLVAAFVATGAPLIIAADETLERRTGRKIKQKGAFRDAVRSSKTRTVTSLGLRWVSMMLLVPVPWSRRVWALPFLTVLAPSEKTNRANGKRHKTSIDWLGQMIRVVRRWFPTRPVVLVVDGALAAIKLGLQCARFAVPVTYISRLRLDAVLHDPPPPPVAGKRGPKPKKGKRQPSLQARVQDPTTVWEPCRVTWYGGVTRAVELATGTALWYTPGEDPLPIRWVLIRDPLGTFEPQALFATDLAVSAVEIVEWFVLRWSEEVTFQEARQHLGLETQRQWSAQAIARTTPVLLGLFSLVTLLAHRLTEGQALPVRTAAWYTKREATFADAIAVVRQHLWRTMKITNSTAKAEVVPIPSAVLHGLVDTLCYAA
jgi:DDE superfamily endonuclease